MHGATLSLFATIKGLKDRGLDVVLVFPSNWPCEEEFIYALDELHIKSYSANIVQSKVDKNYYRHLSIYKRCKLRLSLYKNRLKSFIELSRIIEKERPDVIHTNVGVIHEGFWLAKRYGIPHVFHLREYQDKDFHWEILPSKLIFEKLLRKSAVITITDDIRSHFGLTNYDGACTIYNGICSIKDMCFDASKEKFFFCASRISPEKGYEPIIESFGNFHITHPDYKLVIAGIGTKEYTDYLKTIAREKNCTESVIFLGLINNVLDYMRKATALIVGSYNEGFGRMTAEAAFSGCIVIGRNTAGTKEIIDKIGGYRFDDDSEIEHLMYEVSSMSNSEYARFALNSQKKSLELFSIEQNVEKIYTLYKEITSCSK